MSQAQFSASLCLVELRAPIESAEEYLKSYANIGKIVLLLLVAQVLAISVVDEEQQCGSARSIIKSIQFLEYNKGSLTKDYAVLKCNKKFSATCS